MKNKTLLLVGICFALICFVYTSFRGRTYDVKVNIPVSVTDLRDVEIVMESSVSSGDIIRVENQHIESGSFAFRLRSVHPGEVFLSVSVEDRSYYSDSFYVVFPGIIVCNTLLGNFTGARIIPIFVSLYLAVLLYTLIVRLRGQIRNTIYQYHNVTYLAMIIFLSFALLRQFITLFRYYGLQSTADAVIGSADFFSSLALPFAIFISAYVTASNFKLMRKEGRNWRNMLGFFLGIAVIIGSILPSVAGYFLQWGQLPFVDVHNMNRPDMYIEIIVSNTVSFGVAYLECLLISTIFFSVIAARHIPSFDRDYILILGCKIRSDGGLTKLLQSRADRALQFAEMQKKATGKDIIFVPSGGQGGDEIIPEAQAIRNYLLEKGVPDDRIIPEDQSVNTYENIRNSAALIMEHSEVPNPKIAFSTTNYHVFRSGLIASHQRINAEGIGAPTKAYFWVNAFIREFIATIVVERKTHLRVMGMITCVLTVLALILYYSNTH